MKRFAVLTAFLLILPAMALAQTTKPAARVPKLELPPDFIPASTDPSIGDWQGTGGPVAQVYIVKGQMMANLLKSFDTSGNLIVTLSGKDGQFSGSGWTAAIKDGHFTGSKGDQSFDLQHVVRQSPTLGAKPPAGAVVLFDGTNLDAWAKRDEGKNWLIEAGPAKWTLTGDGAMSIVSGTDGSHTDCILTHQKFGDCHLHVEFRTLGFPSKSAVFLETRYEVNINESYGRTTGTQPGGLDNSMSTKVDPLARPTLPPLQWQTFDIDFMAPRFDTSGKKTSNAIMTVLVNGVKIYDQLKLDPPRMAAARLGEAPTGPIMLQDHLTPLEYRNIWIQETGK